MDVHDGLLTLSNPSSTVVVDVYRGADIVSVVDTRTGVDVLFRTPWAERARAASRRGPAQWHNSSAEAWLESYGGGWQLLCPNAAGPTIRGGVEQGFHGEAAVVPWLIDTADATSAVLHVELFTAPLQIRRSLVLDGSVLTVTDTVTNLAPVPVEFDFQHHPAFGPPLLSADCLIETGARTYVVDPRTLGATAEPAEPGSVHVWPPTTDYPDRRLDRLPPQGEHLARLGWLTDFSTGWAAVRNPRLDLAVGLSWDASVLPNAWLWQELNATTDFPWFGRAYVMALEPSSTTSSGPGRAQTMNLAPEASQQITLRLTLCGGTRPIESIDAAGVVGFADQP